MRCLFDTLCVGLVIEERLKLYLGRSHIPQSSRPFSLRPGHGALCGEAPPAEGSSRTSDRYSKDDKPEKKGSDNEKGLGWAMPLLALGLLRYMSATSNIIHDCDEVFNYWEPLHYLLYKSRFQTWEYSSEFALRSYLYIFLHAVVGGPASWFFSEEKVRVFYIIRVFLGVISSVTEALLVIALSRKYGKRLASYTLAMLCLTSGCFFASTSFLPSTFSMYAVTLSSSLYLLGKYSLAVSVAAAGVILGWPFSILGGGESHLYGTEGPLFYLRNGFNNFNLWFLYPIYPLICVAAAAVIESFPDLFRDKYAIDDSIIVKIAKVFRPIILGLILCVSHSRTFSLLHGYSAPMEIYKHLDYYEDAGNGSVLCVGSEWHRYPSSFFVPSYVGEIRWVDDGFRGLLPLPFNSTLGGTASAPPYFNNKNKASEAQYLRNIDACTFFVELDLKRPYPSRGADLSTWETVAAIPFLDRELSPTVHRSFFIPFLWQQRNVFGTYKLLKRIPKSSSEQ